MYFMHVHESGFVYACVWVWRPEVKVLHCCSTSLRQVSSSANWIGSRVIDMCSCAQLFMWVLGVQIAS